MRNRIGGLWTSRWHTNSAHLSTGVVPFSKENSVDFPWARKPCLPTNLGKVRRKLAIVQFAGTFKEFPPRSIPPSFNPATIMDETIKEIRVKRMIDEAYPMLPKPKGSEGAESTN